MDSRQVVVEIYLALERATGEGSIHKARTAARSIGASFTNADSSKWLEPFISAAKTRRQSAPPTAPFRHLNGTVNKHESAPVVGTTNGLTRGNCIPNSQPSIPGLPNDSLAENHTAPKIKKPPKSKEPKPEDLAAWALTKAAFPLLVKHLDLPATAKAWTARNNNAARDILAAGKSQVEILAAWEFALTDPEARRFYGRIASIAKLAEHWAAIAAIRGGSGAVGNDFPYGRPKLRPGETLRVCDNGALIIDSPNDPPPLMDLIAAGLA